MILTRAAAKIGRLTKLFSLAASARRYVSSITGDNLASLIFVMFFLGN